MNTQIKYKKETDKGKTTTTSPDTSDNSFAGSRQVTRLATDPYTRGGSYSRIVSGTRRARYRRGG